MKIVAGLSCIDDYERLVKTGADEFFVGYVPYEYTKKYGNLFLINRREIFYKRDGEECRLGSTGCGLCALKKLQLAGVTHLKVVGRGDTIDNIEKDVLSLKKAVNLLYKVNDSCEYEALVKKDFFTRGCSKNCYYYK